MDWPSLTIGLIGGFSLASLGWLKAVWDRRQARRDADAFKVRLKVCHATIDRQRVIILQLQRERGESDLAYANCASDLRAIRQQRSEATRRGNVTRANKRRDQHGVNSPVNRELAAGVAHG